MSDITHGKDLVDSLKEPVVEDPIALCAEAAAEIERLRVADGMLRHGIRQLELDLSVKTTEAERLHAEIGRRIQDKRESDGRVLAALEIDERQRAEIERLRASESQAIADADALALEHCTRMAYLVEKYEGIQSGAAWRAWLKARPAIDPALRRAAERRKAKGGG